jgi:hypothetical protein
MPRVPTQHPCEPWPGAYACGSMTRWEYLIVALPQFEAPTSVPGGSAAVEALNREGDEGWEAFGIAALADGTVAVLLKRPVHHGS